LASTISRDDIIAVIGANPSSFPAAGGGAVCFPGFWLIPNLCQQSGPMPRSSAIAIEQVNQAMRYRYR
jgi:hypothetical protein